MEEEQTPASRWLGNHYYNIAYQAAVAGDATLIIDFAGYFDPQKLEEAIKVMCHDQRDKRELSPDQVVIHTIQASPEEWEDIEGKAQSDLRDALDMRHHDNPDAPRFGQVWICDADDLEPMTAGFLYGMLSQLALGEAVETHFIGAKWGCGYCDEILIQVSPPPGE